ncbi:Pregnancy-associated plasma protein-A [Microdochium nivale]|nr:Pregnancy-associated plasma protein-A [Microdochium nivale]
MQLRHILGAAAAAALPLLAVADSHGSNGHNFNCGAGTPSSSIVQSLTNLRTAETRAKRAATTMDYEADIVIPLHLHAVTRVGNPIDSDVMYQQYLVMQNAYAQYGIHFQLDGMTRYEDDNLSFFNATRFFDHPGTNDDRMWYVTHTRKGGYDTLNIWFYEDMEDGMNGVCTLPEEDFSQDSVWRDGCHVHMGTMPGGSREFYNVGFTAIHEAGHWLGLLHPWGMATGTCSQDDDDLVDDTPIQSDPSFNCPVKPDTCPLHPGFDNAWNFMDYSDDTCDGEQFFTPGQRTRMHHSYMAYRSGK